MADALRETVLAPLVWLQARAEEGRTSRVRLRAITAERDSAAYLAQVLPSLLAENERLRQLLRLEPPADHPLRAGRGAAPAPGHRRPHAAPERRVARQGVAAFNPVVAPEGLIGVVSQRLAQRAAWPCPGPTRSSG